METHTFAITPDIDIIPLTGNTVTKANVVTGMYTALTNDPGISKYYVVYKDGLELLTQGPPGSGMDLEVSQPGITQIVIKANKDITNLVVTYEPPASNPAIVDLSGILGAGFNLVPSQYGYHEPSYTVMQKIRLDTAITVASIDYFDYQNDLDLACDAPSICRGVICDSSKAIISQTSSDTCTLDTWKTFTFPAAVTLLANTDYYIGLKGTDIAAAASSGVFTAAVPNGTLTFGALCILNNSNVQIYNDTSYKIGMKLNLV